MANKSTVIRITHAKNDVTSWGLSQVSGEARREMVNLAALFEKLASGQEIGCTITVAPAGTALVAASGTAEFASVVATNKLTVNGVDFTAVDENATAVQFDVGNDDTETAENAAAAINASTNALIAKIVTASASEGTVTITAYNPGKVGNCITIAQTGDTITLSGARLTGGAGDDVASVSYARG